jgi:hypothetical protein
MTVGAREECENSSCFVGLLSSTNQRRTYNQMKTGVANMLDPDRMQKLELVGFEWSCRTVRNAAGCLSCLNVAKSNI